jgi:hypothetical protein
LELVVAPLARILTGQQETIALHLVILQQVVGTEVRINMQAVTAVLVVVAPDTLDNRRVRVRLVKVALVVRDTPLKVLAVAAGVVRGLLARLGVVALAAMAALRPLQVFLALALQLQAVVAPVGKVVLALVVAEPLAMVVSRLMLEAMRLQTLGLVVAVVALAVAVVAAAAPVLSSFVISISKVKNGTLRSIG